MLEIKLESRDNSKPMIVNSRIVSQICEEIDLNIQGVLSGYQIHYAYRMSVIKLLMKENVNLDRYIRCEPFAISEDLEVKSIKMSGSHEVTMVVLGLDFSVPD